MRSATLILTFALGPSKCLTWTPVRRFLSDVPALFQALIRSKIVTEHLLCAQCL